MRPSLLLLTAISLGCAATTPTSHPTPAWRVELERGGTFTPTAAGFELDVPAGATVWLDRPLSGPTRIDYAATVIANGGPNDRLSDLNCFWMATDARSPDDLFATKRSGAFAEYDQLRCYYVGYGGNANTTTRFRRYVGEKSHRPLDPAHDLRDKPHLLTPNHPYHVTLIADGSKIQYWRDGELVFDVRDDAPYTRGYFALRTVASHIRLMDLRISAPGDARLGDPH